MGTESGPAEGDGPDMSSHSGDMSDSVDYSAMSIVWGVLCLLSGVAILYLPSPKPPTEAFAARGQGGQAENIAWRELLFVGYGSVIAFLIMGVIVGAVGMAPVFTGNAFIGQLIQAI